jgi:hypothetical protein
VTGKASIIGNKEELEREGRTIRIAETTDVTETRNCNRNMEAYRHGDSLRLQCSKWHQGTSVHSNGSERNKTRQARNLSWQGIKKTRQASGAKNQQDQCGSLYNKPSGCNRDKERN